MFKVVADYSPTQKGAVMDTSTNAIEYHVETLPLAKRLAEEYVATSSRQESLTWQERGDGVWVLDDGSVYGRIEEVEVHDEMPPIHTADDRAQDRRELTTSQE